MPNELNDAIETSVDGKHKSLCIYLTNPFFENPERTLGDYRTEQKEARERHAMFQEQHRLIQEQHKQLAWSHRLNLVLVLATLLAAAANVWSAYQVSKPPIPNTTQLSHTPPLKVSPSPALAPATTP
jgi:hypothetical protein